MVIIKMFQETGIKQTYCLDIYKIRYFIADETLTLASDVRFI